MSELSTTVALLPNLFKVLLLVYRDCRAERGLHHRVVLVIMLSPFLYLFICLDVSGTPLISGDVGGSPLPFYNRQSTSSTHLFIDP